MSFGSRSLGKPSADEQARMDAIRERGICNACGFRRELQIHHLLKSGLRVSHRATVGLCNLCHKLVNTRQFKARHGTIQQQLDRQDYDIDWMRWEIPDRRIRANSKTIRSSKTVPRPESGFA